MKYFKHIIKEITQILNQNNIFYPVIKINPNKLRIIRNYNTEVYDGEIVIYYKLKKNTLNK